MTISYPLTFPTSPKPKLATVTARTIVGTSESNFTYSTQKQVHSGQRWEMDLVMPTMTDAEAGQWLGFLLSLNGVEGTVMVPEPDRTSTQGVGTGTPKIDGGGQTGSNIETKLWTASTTGILLAGDLIQIGNYMYMVLVDVDSDGSGDATLDIFPNLRTSPTDSDDIVVSDCKTLMRLASNEMKWSTDKLKMYGLTMVFVEEIVS